MVTYTIQPQVGSGYRVMRPIPVDVFDHQGAYAGVLFKTTLGGRDIKTWGPPNLDGPENPDFTDTASLFIGHLRGIRHELGRKKPANITDQDREVAKAIDALVNFN